MVEAVDYNQLDHPARLTTHTPNQNAQTCRLNLDSGVGRAYDSQPCHDSPKHHNPAQGINNNVPIPMKEPWQLIKEEVESAAKFNLKKNTYHGAVMCRNPMDLVTPDEFEWIRNYGSPPVNVETDIMQENDYDDDTMQYIIQEKKWKNTDLCDTMDDVTFNNEIDSFYGDIVNCPPNVVEKINDHSNDQELAEPITWSRMLEEQPLNLEKHNCRQGLKDSGIFMEDGTADGVHDISPICSEISVEQQFKDYDQAMTDYESDSRSTTPQGLEIESSYNFQNLDNSFQNVARPLLQDDNIEVLCSMIGLDVDLVNGIEHANDVVSHIASEYLLGDSVMTMFPADQTTNPTTNHNYADLTNTSLTTKQMDANSAATCSQLSNNIHVSTHSSENDNPVWTESTEILHLSNSSSDILSRASPLEITPMAKKAPIPSTHLFPEHNSNDSETEDKDRSDGKSLDLPKTNLIHGECIQISIHNKFVLIYHS